MFWHVRRGAAPSMLSELARAPTGISTSPLASTSSLQHQKVPQHSHHADLREDPYVFEGNTELNIELTMRYSNGQDDHLGGGVLGHHRYANSPSPHEYCPRNTSLR